MDIYGNVCMHAGTDMYVCACVCVCVCVHVGIQVGTYTCMYVCAQETYMQPEVQMQDIDVCMYVRRKRTCSLKYRCKIQMHVCMCVGNVHVV